MIRLDLVWEIVNYTASLFSPFMQVIFDFVVQFCLAIKKTIKQTLLHIVVMNIIKFYLFL